MSESPARVRGRQAPALAPPRPLFWGFWLLTVLGLLVRALRQPTIAGTYDGRLDELLYAGQRLLAGQWLYDGLVNGTQPLAPLLYAPSAWFGSLPAHRLVILAVNVVGGILLARALRNLAAADLIALRPVSLVPLLGGTAFVVFGQMFPGGLSGHLIQFANTFLALALYSVSRPLVRQARPPQRNGPDLALAGAALLLAAECFARLISPLLMVTLLVLVLMRVPRPLAVLAPLFAGGLAAAALTYLPYAFVPDGAARAWAGAVQLPLEWSSGFAPEGDRLLPLAGDFLGTNVAGLPIWLLALVPGLGLLNLTARQCREPGFRGDRLLLIPAVAVVFMLELLLSFQKGAFEMRDMQLLVLPLVLIMSCGFAEMESSRHRWTRGIALLAMLLMTLIFFNNSFVASVLHTPRRPKPLVQTIEADRAIARRYLAGLAPAERGFTAPQDVALQRQLGQRASTVGIGPEWSLNQQELTPSWATRRLDLPTSPAAVCRQLTDPANRHLVWMRTDPEGPNTEAFLRGCLERQPGQWREISEALGLRSGEYRVFRRDAAVQPP